jgi:hypothetical protein
MFKICIQSLWAFKRVSGHSSVLKVESFQNLPNWLLRSVSRPNSKSPEVFRSNGNPTQMLTSTQKT